ncbi:hypothetical protein GCM10009550_38500 [Actinocorallia libanotica]|uniref:Uncharacterized protein n=1 Tax=Actinocorallia libanotica TaxID=46162 RepID=A0ABP4BTV2_9ACTN
MIPAGGPGSLVPEPGPFLEVVMARKPEVPVRIRPYTFVQTNDIHQVNSSLAF